MSGLLSLGMVNIVTVPIIIISTNNINTVRVRCRVASMKLFITLAPSQQGLIAVQPFVLIEL